ncbi:MAG: DivIVA domain-containing protein [Acidimicrobiia bacterium]|nr:DivIVA domain-containing protein [Acidimicrobiia bacterium]
MVEPAHDSPIDPRYDPAKVAAASFDTVRRGFQEAQVRTFLRDLSRSLRATYDTEDDLRAQLSRLQTRLERAETIDDAALTERLGAEAAKILNAAREAAEERLAAAHEAAEKLFQESHEEAEQLLVRSRADADEIRGRADTVLDEKMAEAEQAAAERALEAEKIVTAAVERANEIVAAAKQEGRKLVIEVQRHREQLLGNLEQRRQRTRVQVERLQAGRDRLLESYDTVQATIDRARHELKVGLPEAKIMADRAARRIEDEAPRSAEDLEVELVQAGEAGLLGRPDEIAAAAAAADGDGVGASLTGISLDVLDDTGPIDVAELLGYPAEPDAAEDAANAPADAAADPDADGDDEAAGESAAVDEDEPAEVEVEAEPEVAAEAADDAEAEVPAAVADQETESAPEVDGNSIFDRLRAEREQAVADAERVLAEQADADEPDTEAEQAHADEPDAGAEVPAAAADQETAPEATALLEARDAALEPLVKASALALKRALADAQNDVLDCHRTGSDAARALQLGQLASAITGPGADAWAAGAESVGRPGSAADATLERVLEAFDREVIDDLRQALDAASTVEQIRAACRQVRSELGSIADAAMVAAFGAGIADTLPEGCPVRWVADERSEACELASAAAGAEVRLGSEFPNGLPEPPHFGGCRCLVAPLHQ